MSGRFLHDSGIFFVYSADPGKFRPGSKSFGSLDLLLSSKIFSIWDPKTNGSCTLCRGTPDGGSYMEPGDFV